MKRKVISAMLIMTMAATMLAGCGGSGDAKGGSADSGEKIILKVFSNLPDRKNGQGLVEQKIIDEYMEKIQM